MIIISNSQTRSASRFQSKAAIWLAALLTLGLLACNRPSQTPKKIESPAAPKPTLSVGIQVSPAMALVMVAEDEGLFDRAGVDVQIKEFTAGKFALQAFLGGSLDVAVSGEVPVTLAALQGNRFRVLTQVVDRTVNEVRVVAWREPGLDTADAYFGARRRKLATSFGGGPEFFTYSFLERHGIPRDSVEILSQRPEDMPATLDGHSVDAIAIFDPFARIAERTLGDRGITFADPDIYSELYVANVLQETIDRRPDVLRAFLQGLEAAEKFITDNPAKARQIVERYTKLEAAVVEDIWPNFVFQPSLNDLFLEYTAAQARWAIAKGDFPPATPIPDFRQMIAPELLSEVDPTAVRLSAPSP